MWTDESAREIAFKKIFHLGPTVQITPTQILTRPGTTVNFTVGILNWENQPDTLSINMVTNGQGTFDLSSIPSSLNAYIGNGGAFNVSWRYDGPDNFADASLKVTVTASQQAMDRTLDTSEILSNTETVGAAAIAMGGTATGILPGQPSSINVMGISGINSPYVEAWVTSETPINIYSIQPPKTLQMDMIQTGFWFNFWIDNKTLLGGNYTSVVDFQNALYDDVMAYKSMAPLYMSCDPYYPDGINNAPLADGDYFLWIRCIWHGWVYYHEVNLWKNLSFEIDGEGARPRIHVDNTPPSTILNVTGLHDPWMKDLRISARERGRFVDSNSTFTLTANDGWVPLGSGVQTTYYRVERHVQEQVLRSKQFIRSPSTLHGIPLGFDVITVNRTEYTMPWTSYTGPFHLNLTAGDYSLVYRSVDKLGHTEAEHYYNFTVADPLSTSLVIGEPKTAAGGNHVQAYVSRSTPFSLKATGGTVRPVTYYRIYSVTYETPETRFTVYKPDSNFTLGELRNGRYRIEYYSTDQIQGIEETHHFADVILDPQRAVLLHVYVDVESPVTTLNASFVTQNTLFSYTGVGNVSAIKTASYRIHNEVYDSGWLNYSEPFNLTGLPPGNYTIEVSAADDSGNVSSDAVTVKLKATADINYDGVVNIMDIGIASQAFGSSPDDQRWNSLADVNQDGKINMMDIAITAKNSGTTY
jgi:hypothetical protein